MIPGLKNAEFIKYGVMHRNTFINSSKVLKANMQMREKDNIFFAGQITGVEGYVESIASGMIAGINVVRMIEGKDKFVLPTNTMLGALVNYVVTPNDKFQPMNANFGILPKLDCMIRDKQERYRKLAEISIKEMNELKIWCS